MLLVIDPKLWQRLTPSSFGPSLRPANFAVVHEDSEKVYQARVQKQKCPVGH
jgi:hypothetical protein